MEPLGDSQIDGTYINYFLHKPSTYTLKDELEISRIDEMISSRDNRFVFVRSKNSLQYQIMDIWAGDMTELEVDEEEFDRFDAFRLYPLEG
jgi:hypothetical protein